MVLGLADCTGRASEAGGKAVGLAALIAQELPVPPGFCVTTEAYRAAVRSGNLQEPIQKLLGGASFRTDNSSASRAIANLFEGLAVPAEIAQPIRNAYAALGDDVHVAIRSSATAEDLAGASFAGQQETYLYVRGADAVVEHVVRCWASLFSPQAIGYRSRFDVDVDDLAMAVVVQVMVPAEAAGVMMTLNPVTGDRSRILVEAAYGLGEGVVRGDVGADRFEVAKDSLEIVERHVTSKTRAHRYVEAAGVVQLVDVADDEQDKPCLDDPDVQAVARLGAAVEHAFGRPMDIEWAVARGAPGAPHVYLLQARPETVWSSREVASNPPKAGLVASRSVDPFDEWDPLHTWSDSNTNWTTTNVALDIHGVMTPLGSTLWNCAEGVCREVFWKMGTLTEDERAVPRRPHHRLMRAFYGRIAWQVDFFGTAGDRMPGTTAEGMCSFLLGRAPGGIGAKATRRFYPRVAAAYLRVATTAIANARRSFHDATLWRDDVERRTPAMNLAEAYRTIRQSREILARVLAAHLDLMLATQPLHSVLEALVRRTGVGDASIFSGRGGGEVSTVVNDIWRAAHGSLTLEDVLIRHGHHGPQANEVSSTVWREDPEPLKHLLEVYARCPDSESPAVHGVRAAGRRWRAETIQDLLGRLPHWQRPAARLAIASARRFMPLHDTGRDAMARCIDACRAAARQAGRLLVQGNFLDEVDDVFFLTIDELVDPLPGNTRELVAQRRARHATYRELAIPDTWRGMPDATPAAAASATAANAIA